MKDSALYEHRFWLQILGDHARFIFNTLSPKEIQDIQLAQQYIQSFDQLLNFARNAQIESDIAAINQEAYTLTSDFRNFKLDLLRRLLFGKVTIGLTPTFINHMVNAIHHDLLWLLDAVGHAATITSDLDPVEKPLMMNSKHFETQFQQLYLKSIEMAGYMRTQLPDFPAFRKFHLDINLEMKLFMVFLNELEQLEITAEVLDRISPLMPDHMMREECYYLNKLAQLGIVPNPVCNPDTPRIDI